MYCIDFPIKDCPKYTDWTEWTFCSVTCGRGQRSRGRACVDDDGDLVDGCVGRDFESVSCINGECPYWGDWTTWTLCEGPCGTQVRRTRTRICFNGIMGDEGCLGDGSEVDSCNVSVGLNAKPLLYLLSNCYYNNSNVHFGKTGLHGHLALLPVVVV